MSNKVKRCPWCGEELTNGMLYCDIIHFQRQRMFYYAIKAYRAKQKANHT